MTAPSTWTGAEVKAAIRRATEEPVWIDMTGGGVATVFIGDPVEVPTIGQAARLAFGPGTFSWINGGEDSTFYAEDANLGPDDWGERPSIQITSLDQLTEATRALLALPDWRASSA